MNPGSAKCINPSEKCCALAQLVNLFCHFYSWGPITKILADFHTIYLFFFWIEWQLFIFCTREMRTIKIISWNVLWVCVRIFIFAIILVVIRLFHYYIKYNFIFSPFAILRTHISCSVYVVVDVIVIIVFIVVVVDAVVVVVVVSSALFYEPNREFIAHWYVHRYVYICLFHLHLHFGRSFVRSWFTKSWTNSNIFSLLLLLLLLTVVLMVLVLDFIFYSNICLACSCAPKYD